MQKLTYRGYMINGTAVIGYADSEEDFIASQSGYKLTGIEEVELIFGEWIAKDWLGGDTGS